MPKFTVIAPVKIAKRGIVREGEIDLPEAEAALLVRQGFLADPNASTEVETPAKAPAAKTKPKGKAAK